MTSPPNITNITPPRVPFTDERTGLISREWYRFLLNLFTLTGSGQSAATLEDLQLSPLPIDYTAEIAAVANIAEIGTQPPVIFGTLAYQNSENAFVTRLNTVSATTGVRNGTLAEDSGFVTLLGTNGAITGIGTTAVTVTQATGFRPFASNTYNLGTSGQRWASTYSTEFLAGAGQQARFKEDSGFAVVDGDNGVTTGIGGSVVTVTQASGFRPNASYSYNLGTSSQRWNSAYAQEFLAGDSQQAQYKESSGYALVNGSNGVRTAYNSTVITEVNNVGLRPNVSASYSLGTSSYYWTGVYGSVFYADNTTTKFYQDTDYAVLTGSNGVITAIGTTSITVTQATGFRPFLDNTYDLGTSGQRWGTVYAAVGTINTSDATEKQQIQELTDAERRVAQRVKSLVRTFKWNSAVDLKGDAARTHVGVMAQDVYAAFAAEGLDANKYGLFCSDDIELADGTVTSRLGLRYDQLLTFALAAL
jgi:hypothetical protein